MLKKRKHPRKPRRIELKINNVTLVIKEPVKWTFKLDIDTVPPCFNPTPLVPFSITGRPCLSKADLDPLDIHNHKFLVQAATGKRLEEIIEEQERVEVQVNAFRRMYNFWVKGEM